MKPNWPNVCNHTRKGDKFLGSFEWAGHHHDVYVYRDNAESAHVPDMHVCIRYGNRGDLYISPGPVDHFVQNASRENAPEDYRLALPLVQKWLARPKCAACGVHEDIHCIGGMNLCGRHTHVGIR